MNKTDRMAVIMREMLKTYRDKNTDYGDSFAKSYEEFGLTAPVVRMSDKMERLKSLSKAEAKVKDESKRDTLIDLANYAMMTVIELDIENEKVKDAEEAFEHVVNVRMGNAKKASAELSREIREALDSIDRTGTEDKEKEPNVILKNGQILGLQELRPDLKTGLYRGYRIYVKHISAIYAPSSPNGYYCGYVAIPFRHPFYKKDYQDLDWIDVHGGLTFSGYLGFSNDYLLGFDCSHAGDSIKIQDEDYTLAECKKLVDQLIKVYGKEIDKRDI